MNHLDETEFLLARADEELGQISSMFKEASSYRRARTEVTKALLTVQQLIKEAQDIEAEWVASDPENANLNNEDSLNDNDEPHTWY